MYWLHTDETNADPSQGRFFIYGGLIATAEQMSQAHDAVEHIRSEAGFRPGDSFKCNTRSRPDHVTRELWTEAKGAAIRAVGNIGMDMIVTGVHHKIAANKDDQTRAVWSMENLAYQFGSRYLASKQAYGALCIDRLPEKYAYLQIERMFQGLVKYKGENREIPGVIHYSVTSQGASHMNSLVDVCLGSLRICVNAAFESEERRQRVAAEILPSLWKVLWSDYDGKVMGQGIRLFPSEVFSSTIRADYVTLARKLDLFRLGQI